MTGTGFPDFLKSATPPAAPVDTTPTRLARTLQDALRFFDGPASQVTFPPARMSLPRVRITVRGMMVAVALVGVGAGCVARLVHRRNRLLDLASGHVAQLVPVDHVWAMTAPRRVCIEMWLGANGLAISPQEGARIERRNEWHRTVAEKYRRAAASPWLPVEPDPPAPK